MKRTLKLLVPAVLVSLAVAAGVLHAQSSARPVGVVAQGQTAIEFIGKLDEPTVSAATFYGYVTHVAGASDASLFTDPAQRTEATAKLTFVSNITLDAHLVQQPLFVTTGSGRARFYFNPAAGAKIDDPASFAQGKLVATDSLRFRDVLAALSQTTGIQSAVGDLRQLSAGNLTLGGKQYRFGRVGLRQRVTMHGEGTRTLEPLSRTVVTAGDMVVTG